MGSRFNAEKGGARGNNPNKPNKLNNPLITIINKTIISNENPPKGMSIHVDGEKTGSGEGCGREVSESEEDDVPDVPEELVDLPKDKQIAAGMHTHVHTHEHTQLSISFPPLPPSPL